GLLDRLARRALAHEAEQARDEQRHAGGGAVGIAARVERATPVAAGQDHDELTAPGEDAGRDEPERAARAGFEGARRELARQRSLDRLTRHEHPQRIAHAPASPSPAS